MNRHKVDFTQGPIMQSYLESKREKTKKLSKDKLEKIGKRSKILEK